MTKGSLQDFELLKAAMGNKVYLRNIIEDEKNQLDFLIMLGNNKLTCQQILELMTLTRNEQVRSLLIIHLLSQQEYLTSLKGESVLARLANAERFIPSRLNALVHQLDITILSETVIDKLPPETAVSILCSVPHFHQLSEEQVNNLIKKYPYPQVILYWLNHYSSMPNASFTLAHLLKVADTHISTQLTKMNNIKREAIITNMIKHLELFDPVPKILYEQNEEIHLILAIRLFLNGHQNKTYVTYIHRLANKLVLQNHQFSLPAIQGLLSLHGKQEFTELTNKTTCLINHYLRTNAQAGETELFYQSARINIDAMTKRIHLKAWTPKAALPAKGFFANLLSANQPDKVTEQAVLPIIPEHPLIEQLAERKKHTIAIVYFLIHFNGDYSRITKLIHAYLSYFVHEQGKVSRYQSLYPLADLIGRSDLEHTIREEIFISFLRYPNLYDEQISLTLFLFDAKRIIQYFGLKGGKQNYTQVIDLCTLALSKLDPDKHREIINMAATARSEARLELSFNEGNGFFASLFMHLKRCWVSGWSGFFSPNLPVYVAPVSSHGGQNQVAETNQAVQSLPYKTEPNLQRLLNEMRSPLTLESLDELIEALNLFSLKEKSNNELEIRQKVQVLFHKLISNNKKNREITDWIINNQHHVTVNCYRLLELTLINGPQSAVASLLTKINEDSSHFQHITLELTDVFPEQQEEKTTTLTIPPVIESTLLETTSELAYSAINWAKDGLGTFFNPHSSPLTQSSSKETGTTELVV
ncbi:hypothetical protein TUM19329_04020 [Legionella antarctica]|uniref:Dot/Icm secretion system substrate n=1 Tax=Legionella antarctica TaxID=2708020 RepID=A0A6F8T0P8_9GAMM|nr:hypothetical protein [Legionella antarctica]BCA94041.1 hypothetical protein TUM19329_04020 [Legionella antarctica]